MTYLINAIISVSYIWCIFGMFFKLATTDLEGNTVLYKYVVVEWLSFLSDGLPNEHVFDNTLPKVV